jgi:penicillin-binding protein 1C
MTSHNSEWDLRDRHGQPLRTVRPDNGPFRQQVYYAEIPQSLVQATLAAEDRRFWRHPGVDWRATLRAAWQFVEHGRIVSGGSTITQQLIKIAQPRPRTLGAKLWQAAQALRLEQIWDKQRILCEYFNRLDYGNFNRGCVAAAQFYFGKPLRDLSPAECALLAALPQAPSRLNPLLHFELAHKRQQWILGQMRRAGWLDEQACRRAFDEPLRLASRQRVFEAPHFVDLVMTYLQREADPGFSNDSFQDMLGSKNVHLAAGGPILTTLDLPLNRFAEATLRQHLTRLQSQHVSNGALVVLDNNSGDVLVLVGSENYFAPAAGQVNGAWAARSVGSTFKPFTYLLALEHGATPATIVADVPTEFATSTGLFAPANYNRRCYGPMRYRLALANSLNISAVKVLASIGGPYPLLQLLRGCGLTTLDRPAEHYGLGLTIGTGEARLLELANAYACLARLGQSKPWRLLLDSETSTSTKTRRVADPAAAFLIADILSDNAARAFAFGPESALRFDFPVACKTGTSSDFRDNWAFGYTPEFTVGVWVGNFDGAAMRQVSGVTGAAPILHDLIEHLHQRYGTTWYSTPTNIVECSVHPLTGKRILSSSASSSFSSSAVSLASQLILSTDAVTEKFLTSNLPLWESTDDYDVTQLLAGTHSSVSQAEVAFRPKVRLSSEYRQWFATGDNWIADHATVCASNDELRILFPLPGTTLFLDPDLPQQGRRLRLSATGPESLEWRSDSLEVFHEANRPFALLTAGRHELIVRDPATGQEALTWIEVLAR